MIVRGPSDGLIDELCRYTWCFIIFCGPAITVNGFCQYCGRLHIVGSVNAPPSTGK